MAARTLQELVAEAADVHSGRVAVTYDGGSASGGPVSLRYRDLAQLAAGLARVLRKSCSPNPGVIGLYCSDDLFTPVWILGILRCPAAYVPVDPEAPGLLSARVMSRCGLSYCAVKTDLLQVQRFQTALDHHVSVEVCAVLPKFKLTVVQVTPAPLAEHRPGAARRDPADLAYVLHTSGTTGAPKIVRVPHRCILPNIRHLRSLFQMTADDVVFLASPLTFDPSVVDIFLALSSGAQLLILPSVVKKTPVRLAQLLFGDHKTTVLQVTPTLLVSFGPRTLKQEVLSSASSLRVLALGGEACPSPALLRSWRHQDNNTHIYNIYGVTEVSCWACCYKIPESVLQSSDTVEVRDDRGRVVTEGDGQVFIGGEDRVCLLDDEDAVVPGTMRATGDWVNVRDAQLRYLGRRDRLIKRHGKRVNLESVQQVRRFSAAKYERCRNTIVLLFFKGSTNMKCWLSLLLPSHSVPDTLVLVPALPQTAHGERRTHCGAAGQTPSLTVSGVLMLILSQVKWTRRPKRARRRSTVADEAVTVVRRAGEVTDMKTRNVETNLSEEEDSGRHSEGDALDLSLSWSSDTGRCVDASPVLLVQHRTDQRSDESRTTAFIGSHSHRVQALDLGSGGLLWERVLGDRIEASAAVSRCGSLVVIGCYDGCVYFLCTASGETRWVFETGDAVKSSPAVDPLTGLVMVGSHDGHVYALNPEVKQCVWRRHCGGGAVFSSPHLGASPRQLYVASLGGHLLCLQPDSGEVLWSHRRDVPFFSSPNGSSGHVLLGSVDGNICCFSSTGTLVWQFLTKGPVFSSPCFTPDRRRVLCGSHDTAGRVFSSPCVFDGPAVGRRGTLVALASTDGAVWILDGWDGHTLASLTLPGELFSSPVVWGRSLVVGCRNDHVYCLKLTLRENSEG
uniref:Uncharacterized protein n=1 Tax=Mola mola TaxID=94237 RepID=A0A3Q4AV41_MOLML